MTISQSQLKITMLISASVLFLGCSVAEEKRQLYRQSHVIEPLRMPEGLQQPQGKHVLAVPQVVASEPVDMTPPVNLPEELLFRPKHTDQNEDEVE